MHDCKLNPKYSKINSHYSGSLALHLSLLFPMFKKKKKKMTIFYKCCLLKIGLAAREFIGDLEKRIPKTQWEQSQTDENFGVRGKKLEIIKTLNNQNNFTMKKEKRLRNQLIKNLGSKEIFFFKIINITAIIVLIVLKLY